MALLSSLYTAQVWQVTSVTDAGGGVALQVAGPLGTLKLLISGARGRFGFAAGRSRLIRADVGEAVRYDISILVKNLPMNRWFWTYRNAEPWMYVVVTDADSGWYGSIFRIERIIAPHSRQESSFFHLVFLASEMKDADKVYLENGQLRAKQ